MDIDLNTNDLELLVKMYKEMPKNEHLEVQTPDGKTFTNPSLGEVKKLYKEYHSLRITYND